MKQEVIKSLTKNFESYVNKTENDIEFWFARDLQELLGYTKWDNFIQVISKAKSEVSDHFAGVGKMVDLGSGSRREIQEQATCKNFLQVEKESARKIKIIFPILIAKLKNILKKGKNNLLIVLLTSAKRSKYRQPSLPSGFFVLMFSDIIKIY